MLYGPVSPKMYLPMGCSRSEMRSHNFALSGWEPSWTFFLSNNTICIVGACGLSHLDLPLCSQLLFLKIASVQELETGQHWLYCGTGLVPSNETCKCISWVQTSYHLIQDIIVPRPNVTIFSCLWMYPALVTQPRCIFSMLRHITGLSREQKLLKEQSMCFCLAVCIAKLGTINKKVLNELLF